MELREYQQQTKRTLPDLGSYQLNIDHMIYGMNSEFNEIMDAKDSVNLSEEYTDILWYLSNYCNFTGIDMTRFTFSASKPYHTRGNYFLHLVSEISKLTNLEKRELAYKKMVNPTERLDVVSSIFIALNDCFCVAGLNPHDAMEKNINKLKARYPEKFTEELALNRDLQTERKVLEGENGR